MLIRSGRPDEIPAVLFLWNEAEAIPGTTDTPEALTTLLAHDSEALLVAVTSAGQVVGTALVTWDGWRGGVWRLAVHPQWRRQGLARSLVWEAERRLFLKGARRLSVLIEGTDPRAVAFWSRQRGYHLDTGAQRYVARVA